MARTSSSPKPSSRAGAKSPVVEQLHALEGDGAAQGAFAATLLAGQYGKDVMQAALAVLAENPDPAAREPILSLFARYSADKGVRDQGAYFRRGLLDALRPVAERADAELLAQAACRYEYWPPDFAEDAVLLRTSALVALAGVDEDLARFHAARLLVDPYVQPMSGEPALTAARVLGVLGEQTVLWSYIFAEDPPRFPEVTAECLRQLVALPEGLLNALLDRYTQKPPAAVLLGLVDLLIGHQTGPHGRDFLRRQLLETRDADIYRYLAMSMVASGKQPLLDDLLDLAKVTQDRRKLAVLAEAFDLLAHQPQFRTASADIKRRIALK
jgi:xanthosine utilization system XapX-like protein